LKYRNIEAVQCGLMQKGSHALRIVKRVDRAGHKRHFAEAAAIEMIKCLPDTLLVIEQYRQDKLALQITIKHHHREALRRELHDDFVGDARVEYDRAIHLTVHQHATRGAAFRADKQLVIRFKNDTVNALKDFVVECTTEARDK